MAVSHVPKAALSRCRVVTSKTSSDGLKIQMEERLTVLVEYCKRVPYAQLANKFVLILGMTKVLTPEF